MLQQSIGKMLGGRGTAVLVYGASGTGKTSCIRNLNPEKGVVLTTEPEGLEALQRFGWDHGNFYHLDEPKRLEDVLRKLAQENYEWICLDTLSGYYDQLWDEFMRENQLSPDDISFRTFRYCLNTTQAVLMRFMACVDAGIHVILLCHQKELTEQGPGYSSNATCPGLPGQLPEKFCKRMALVLRTNKVEREGKTSYVLSNPSGAHVGKDLTGRLKGIADNDIAPLLTRTPMPKESPKPAPKQKAATVSKARPKAKQGELPEPEEKKEEEKPVRLKVLPKAIDSSEVKYLLELGVEANLEVKELIHYVKTKYGCQLKELTEEQLGELTVYLTTIIDQRKTDTEEVF